jgi:hypothetical protein
MFAIKIDDVSRQSEMRKTRIHYRLAFIFPIKFTRKKKMANRPRIINGVVCLFVYLFVFFVSFILFRIRRSFFSPCGNFKKKCSSMDLSNQSFLRSVFFTSKDFRANFLTKINRISRERTAAKICCLNFLLKRIRKYTSNIGVNMLASFTGSI